MSLQDRLDALKERIEGGGRANQAIARATRELIASGQVECARRAGEVAPSFELLDENLDRVRSEDLLRQGPLVASFYCGSWSPFCELELRALEEARSSIAERGATMVALTTEGPAESRRLAQRAKLGFRILTDPQGAVTAAFGLRIRLPDHLVAAFEETFGVGLAHVNTGDSGGLAMPARYVVGQDGVIAYAEVNADHTRRPDPGELLPTLDGLRRIWAA